jgi:hypothetical protein
VVAPEVGGAAAGNRSQDAVTMAEPTLSSFEQALVSAIRRVPAPAGTDRRAA